MHTSPPFLPIIYSVLLFLSQVSFSFYNSNQNILSLPNTIVRAIIYTFVGIMRGYRELCSLSSELKLCQSSIYSSNIGHPL